MSQFTVLYRTILGAIATKGRLALLGALGGIAVLIGFATSAGESTATPQDAADLVNGYGLSVLVPVVALVFAAAALGDMVEDSTLVYLWLRPVPREVLALAATAAAAPPDEPPAECSMFQGLRHEPWSLGSVFADRPNSGELLRPMMTSPAALQRLT